MGARGVWSSPAARGAGRVLGNLGLFVGLVVVGAAAGALLAAVWSL